MQTNGYLTYFVYVTDSNHRLSLYVIQDTHYCFRFTVRNNHYVLKKCTDVPCNTLENSGNFDMKMYEQNRNIETM